MLLLFWCTTCCGVIFYKVDVVQMGSQEDMYPFGFFNFVYIKAESVFVIWLSLKRNKHVMCTLIFTNHINTVELVQSEIRVSDILWHPTKLYGPKVFLLTNIKPEYFDILYNPTHFPGTWVCRIRQVPLYSSLDTHHTYLVHYHYIYLSLC